MSRAGNLGSNPAKARGAWLAAAAVEGLLAGCASGAPASSVVTVDVATTASASRAVAEDKEPTPARRAEPEKPPARVVDRHCCKGSNDCKGLGNCKVEGRHDCKGMNNCKGLGGCKSANCVDTADPIVPGMPVKAACGAKGNCRATTQPACCKGLNDCKAKGWCKVEGKHECKGMNDCKGQGGCKPSTC
jgi:hypothetical protein